jgi:uncharacterized membrane protein YvbJ
MSYCSHCGAQILDDSFFCSKCGTRTVAGVKAGVGFSSDEIREVFIRMSKEMETAFHIVAKNVQDAFETARKNVQKPTGTEGMECPNCAEKNPANVIYCYKCGKKF